jgi:hypothetical protein
MVLRCPVLRPPFGLPFGRRYLHAHSTVSDTKESALHGKIATWKGTAKNVYTPSR